VVPSAVQLKAHFWRPKGTGLFPVVLFSHASGSTGPAHTGPFVITETAEKFGPIFVKHAAIDQWENDVFKFLDQYTR